MEALDISVIFIQLFLVFGVLLAFLCGSLVIFAKIFNSFKEKNMLLKSIKDFQD
jgi:hypothetical protein